MQNNDEKCFKWSVIAALHQEEKIKHHPERNSLIQHYEDQLIGMILSFLSQFRK